MESIRKALGAQQINYYGFSYGTYLGQVYATLHPDRVRRMVFDGVVDPSDVWYDANLDQDIAVRQEHRHLLRLGRQARRRLPPRHRRQAVENALLRRADAAAHEPGRRARSARTSGTTSSSAPATTSTAGTTSPTRSPPRSTTATSARLKAALRRPRPAPGADNSYANLPRGPVHRRARGRRSWTHLAAGQLADLRERAVPDLEQRLVQRAVPVPGRRQPGTPVDVNGARGPAVLLIDETNDAATPFAGASRCASASRGRVLIEGVGGTTHAGSLSGVAVHRRPDRRPTSHRRAAEAAAGPTAPTSSATRCRSPTPPRTPPLRSRAVLRQPAPAPRPRCRSCTSAWLQPSGEPSRVRGPSRYAAVTAAARRPPRCCGSGVLRRRAGRVGTTRRRCGRAARLACPRHTRWAGGSWPRAGRSRPSPGRAPRPRPRSTRRGSMLNMPATMLDGTVSTLVLSSRTLAL